MKKSDNALEIVDLSPAEIVTEETQIDPVQELHEGVGALRTANLFRGLSEVVWIQKVRALKNSKAYKAADLTWAMVCKRLGISVDTVDRRIAEYEQRGEAYFDLKEMLGVTGEALRWLGPVGKTDGCFVIDGKKIQENKVAEIRAAVQLEINRRRAAEAEASTLKSDLDKARTERDNAKRAVTESNRKLLAALHPRDFEGADDDYKTMLRVQAGIDTELARLNSLRGRELSDDNQRRYVSLCDYLHTAFLRAVDDAKVTFDSYLDPADPGITLALDDPSMDHGVNILAEFASTPKGGK